MLESMTISQDDWARIDAGGVGDADAFDVIDGRPPEAAPSIGPLYYPALDPDAPENQLSISPWTKLWFSQLPTFVKVADQAQNTETGGWPMARFMDAVGHIADGVRSTVQEMYDGTWTNPATVPDRALPWLASVLGVPRSQKGVPLPQLREALVNMVEDGKAPVGTRTELANATKQFLTDSKVVSVRAAAEVPNYLTPTDEALVNAVGMASVRALFVGPQAPATETINRWTGTPYGSPSERLRYGTVVAENLVHNSTFQVDLAGWSTNAYTTQTRDTAVKETGLASARLNPTAAEWYWLETYRTSPAAGEHVVRARIYVEATRTVRLRVWQYDGGFSISGASQTLTPGWQWIEMPFTLDSASHRFRVSLQGGPGDPDPTPLWVDRIYAARATHAASGHFDGDTPDSPAEHVWVDTDTRRAHTWDNTANAWVEHAASAAQAGAVVDEREAGDMLRAHTIVVLVRSDQVPGGDLVWLADSIRSVGVIPAGHSLYIITAQPTWETFDSRVDALGGSWSDYEEVTRVWTDVESLGLADFE